MQFPKFVSRCSILLNTRMSNLVILKRGPFEFYGKTWKKGLFYLGPKLVFLANFWKDFMDKSFDDLQSIVIENFKPVPLCSLKWRPFNLFPPVSCCHRLDRIFRMPMSRCERLVVKTEISKYFVELIYAK